MPFTNYITYNRGRRDKTFACRTPSIDLTVVVIILLTIIVAVDDAKLGTMLHKTKGTIGNKQLWQGRSIFACSCDQVKQFTRPLPHYFWSGWCEDRVKWITMLLSDYSIHTICISINSAPWPNETLWDVTIAECHRSTSQHIWFNPCWFQ